MIDRGGPGASTKRHIALAVDCHASLLRQLIGLPTGRIAEIEEASGSGSGASSSLDCRMSGDVNIGRSVAYTPAAAARYARAASARRCHRSRRCAHARVPRI